MNKQVFFAAAGVLAALLFSSCSEAPKPAPKAESEAKKEPAKAPEAVAAQLAYYEGYKAARAWATDLLGLSVVSGEVKGIKNEEGKAGVWTVTFVSPSRKEARVVTWAAANGEGEIRQGINVGPVLPWGGDTPASMSFTNSEFTVDSDAAYKTAAEKAAPWLKAHPDQKVSFRLGHAKRFPAPVWYVMFGTEKNGYAVFVNALTGAILK